MSRDSFGDVTGEYRALLEGAGVVEGLHALVRVTGPDAATFLDSLLSQDLSNLAAGEVVRSLLLAPQGKLRALLWVERVQDEFRLVADAGAAAEVAGDLNRFKLRVEATIGAPESVLDLVGPDSPAVLEGLGTAREDLVAMPAPLGDLPRWFVHGPLVDDVVAAGATRVGFLAAAAVRVEAGEPSMGVDVDEGTIPQEAGVVEETVSFTKGCYLGQELVARIDSRGRVNRHLRGVVMTENALPPAGAEIVAGERAVGSVTSVTESLRVGAPIGLGLVRREIEPGTRVLVRWDGGEAGAEIRALPLV